MVYTASPDCYSLNWFRDWLEKFHCVDIDKHQMANVTGVSEAQVFARKRQ